MLAHEYEHCRIEIRDCRELALLAALALVMYRFGIRRVHDLPPRLLYSVGKINVFAIHEIILVEITDLVEHALSQHHQGTGKNVHLGFGIRIHVSNIVFSEYTTFGK